MLNHRHKIFTTVLLTVLVTAFAGGSANAYPGEQYDPSFPYIFGKVNLDQKTVSIGVTSFAHISSDRITLSYGSSTLQNFIDAAGKLKDSGDQKGLLSPYPGVYSLTGTYNDVSYSLVSTTLQNSAIGFVKETGTGTAGDGKLLYTEFQSDFSFTDSCSQGKGKVSLEMYYKNFKKQPCFKKYKVIYNKGTTLALSTTTPEGLKANFVFYGKKKKGKKDKRYLDAVYIYTADYYTQLKSGLQDSFNESYQQATPGSYPSPLP